jgi:glycosyltransferase involved in cell wall biosynthesis
MRVGFLFSHPLTESLGSARRALSLATGLKEKGIEPIILTPFNRRRYICDIRVESVPNFLLNTGLERLAYKIAKGLTYNKVLYRIPLQRVTKGMSRKAILQAVKRLKIDVLQIEQEPTASFILSTSETFPVPLVLDFHGIWAEELVDAGVLARNNENYCSLQVLVEKIVSRMDAVLVMGEEMAKYVTHEYDAKPEKVHLIELGAKPFITKELPKKEKPIKVIYGGILSKDKNANLLLDSIPYVLRECKEVIFYLTRRGNLLKKVSRMKKKFGASIRDFWFDEERNLFDFMANCHVGALTLPNNLSYRMNPAAKFFDYMAVGLPVVANDIGGWTGIVEKEGVGILTKDDPESFAEGLLKITEDPRKYLEYSGKCLRLLEEKYNSNKIAEKLLRVYEALGGNK